MHTDDTINLGRALAEVIFGLLIAIALHLGLPEAAVVRLRARMAVTAEEWEALYSAWLAARLAPSPVQSRRTSRRHATRQAYSARRRRRRLTARPAAFRPAPIPAAPPPCAIAPEGQPSIPPHTRAYVPTGQPRKFRVWPAGPILGLFVAIS
jgi:hypothetical protein